MRLLAVLTLLPLATSSLRLCFDKSPNRSLFARPLLSLRNLSLEKCFSACLEMPRETCKSVTYTRKTSVCQLNGKSKQEVKIVKNPMSDFYHRHCFDKPSVAIRRDTVATDSSACFSSTPGKVLIGIVDQLVRDVASVADCQGHCSNSQTKYDIVCKSAMYYEKDKECILASQSKADIPDLFIDDDKALYLENSCMDKSDKSVVVKTSDVFKGSSKFSENDSSKGDEELEPLKTEKTTLATILASSSPATPDIKVELSGYEGPSDSVSNQNREDLLTTTTTTTSTTTTTTAKPIAPKVIDNYNVVNTPKTAEYGRRLRDTRVKSCFREVRPIGKMEALRVVKAYSLEQCTDMCRLCTKCLVKQKKCQAVAFDISRELCALATKRLTDGGSFKDDIIYHNRMDC